MSLEKKRIQTEILKIECAIAEKELKIEERHEDIKRLEENIEIQKKAAKEKKEILNSL